VLFFTRIVGVGSFTGDLLVAQQTYTLSLLHTQNYVTLQTHRLALGLGCQ